MKAISNYRTVKDRLFEDFKRYFSTYPLDISDMLSQLDKWDKALETDNPYEKKALVYKMAADCPVKLFGMSPFFFEMKSGRIRNSSENGFPPGPGLEGWYMAKHMDLAYAFQAWMKPYKSIDLIWGDVFADYAHHSVGYEKVLHLGLQGIRKEIADKAEVEKNKRRLSLYRSMTIGINSLSQVANNFANEAGRLLETETNFDARLNLEFVMNTASKVPEQPAESFAEALCVIEFLRETITAIEGVAVAVLGHLDRILFPYYSSDVAKGRITHDEAYNLICHFLCLTDARWDPNTDFSSTNNSLTIGGCEPNGTIVWNDVTRMILDAYEEYRFVNPKVQVRLTAEHPSEAFEHIAKILSGGVNVFSVLNDKVIIESNMRMGKALEDARQYAAGGCQEPVMENKEYNSRAFCFINLPQLLNSCLFPELTDFFRNETPDFEESKVYNTFDNLYHDFIERLRKLFITLTKVLGEYDVNQVVFNPCPLLSATIDDCIQKGKDLTEGGARYNCTSVPLVGIGTALNSLFAIKEIVFDQKMMTLSELKKVLGCNFEGHERLHGYIMNRCPKFGMDSAEVNSFARRFFKDAAAMTSGIPNTRGGLFEASLFVFYLFDWMKCATGATADGRKYGTVLSRGINPPDFSGYLNIANLLHTIDALDLADYPGVGVSYLELPIAADGIGPRMIAQVIEAFIQSGGSALDLNLLDPETLVQAKKEKEKYQKLIVRVCGFSAYFTSLKENIQDEIIERAFIGQ